MSSSNKRILFVDLGSHYGGVEVYIAALAEMLKPRAVLFALCSLPKLASALREQGVRVICIPILYNKWCKAVRLLLAIFILPYMVLRFRIETVQINGYFESMLLLMTRLLRRTSIYTMHGPFEMELYRWYKNPERFFPRYLSRSCLRLASQIVCVSGAVGDIARTAFAPSKIRVIPNWINNSFPPKVNFALHKPVRLLFAGRIEKYKGVQLVLEAMMHLPDTELVVLGEGTYLPTLERSVAGLNVHFKGFQPNPSIYYEATDIFINPSLGPEGLPLVSLEAMGRGIPCLFSNLPVHAEISDQGRAALLFEKGNANDLRAKLEDLIRRPGLREEISKRAIEKVDSHYSSKAAKAQYLQLFGLANES